jgi:hypothetical protein
MSSQDLKALLEDVEDTRELVLASLAHSSASGEDGLMAAWLAARTEASYALEHWRESPGPRAYAVYRAAEDRADAAQAALTP